MAKSIDEIAADIGVSVTTVKLVINGKANQYRISQKTQQRVQEYIAQYGCRINQAARSLKLKRSDTLGLVIPNLSNPFFSQIAEYLGNLCQEKGYQLVTVSSQSSPTREKKLTDTLIKRDVDGLFITSSTAECQQALIKAVTDKPLVFIDRDFGLTNHAVVTSNNYQGSFAMTTQLLQHCSDDIYFLFGDAELPSIKQRIEGFIAAHNQAKRPLAATWNISVRYNTEEYGREAMRQLDSQLTQLPKALVFSSLPILQGALMYIIEKYKTLPEDLSLATFDDHPMLALLSNYTLSVSQNTHAIAEHSAQMMLSLLDTNTEKSHLQLKTVVSPSLRSW